MTVLQGVVIAVRPRWVLVRAAGRAHACDVPKALKRGPREQRTLLAVGDRVTLETLGAEEGVIRSLEPRRSKISRVGSVRPLREHVIAANVDQLLAIQALDLPRFNRRGLDRLLVVGEVGRVRSAVCLNKIDLAENDEPERLLEPYRRIGYACFATSATAGDGLEELAGYLAGRETILLGPSGVGKSTLINQLLPEAHLPTGRVSRATRKGRHTTARIDYVDLPTGGAVLDTPGLRAIQPWVAPEELAAHFREMSPFLGRCRFPDCLHRTEPGCAVREAAEAGEISGERHASYCRILEGLLAESRPRR